MGITPPSEHIKPLKASHVAIKILKYHYVRKNAHFFAYMLLGVLVANALRTGDSGTLLANVVLLE